MRRVLMIGFILLLCTIFAERVWAFVSASANISKENAYAILKPPAGDAVITKENGYAILKPPTGAVISKENAYAILKPPTGVVISKLNGYAIVQKRLPTVQIIE